MWTYRHHSIHVGQSRTFRSQLHPTTMVSRDQVQISMLSCQEFLLLQHHFSGLVLYYLCVYVCIVMCVQMYVCLYVCLWGGIDISFWCLLQSLSTLIFSQNLKLCSSAVCLECRDHRHPPKPHYTASYKGAGNINQVCVASFFPDWDTSTDLLCLFLLPLWTDMKSIRLEVFAM